MRAGAIKWILFVWVVMVPCLLSAGRVADAPSAEQYALVSMAESATESGSDVYTLNSPYDDDLQAKREANRWAIPSTSLTLQGTAGQTSSTDVVQRLLRMCGLLLHASDSVLSYSCDGAEQIVLFKRFHIGYYIYHHCQLRC